MSTAAAATTPLMREANAAASDAAEEARAEVLDQGQKGGPAPEMEPPRRPGKKRTAAELAKDPYVRFAVDVWITNFNSVEFGFYKRARNKAKSRQFTSDMDIFAEVIENGERVGLLGYREELWTKQKGFDKRLVFKLFGEKLNWQGTMDMMLGRSVEKTIGARGLPVTSYSVNTNDHEQIVYVERSANKWKFMPEYFSFFLMDAGKLSFYRIKQDLLSIGRDYSVYNGEGKKIGVIDGHILSLGGYWTVKVLKPYADKRLMAVLKMFTGHLVFNHGGRRHVKYLAGEVAAGRAVAKIEKQEAELYLNPRRVR